MGEENKGDARKEEEKKEKEEETQEIILKVEMHCEACARKIARTLKGFQGVDEVGTDIKASKVVVKGKGADPIKVCEKIQKKSGRKVELISPLPKSPPEEKKEENKQLKEEPPAVVTAVLKVRMHCEACAQVLRKRIRKIKGVESVETNFASEKVIVKGIIDPAKLVDNVYKRTGKQADIVKDEEKKEDEKKGDKKESEERRGVEDDMIKRSEFWPTKFYSDYANPYPPQIFSDENPNACSVM